MNLLNRQLLNNTITSLLIFVFIIISNSCNKGEIAEKVDANFVGKWQNGIDGYSYYLIIDDKIQESCIGKCEIPPNHPTYLGPAPGVIYIDYINCEEKSSGIAKIHNNRLWIGKKSFKINQSPFINSLNFWEVRIDKITYYKLPDPTCNDGVQNQDETGIDCGGLNCDACPTCYDSIQNQNETSIDCGGNCKSCFDELKYTIVSNYTESGTFLADSLSVKYENNNFTILSYSKNSEHYLSLKFSDGLTGSSVFNSNGTFLYYTVGTLTPFDYFSGTITIIENVNSHISGTFNIITRHSGTGWAAQITNGTFSNIYYNQ